MAKAKEATEPRVQVNLRPAGGEEKTVYLDAADAAGKSQAEILNLACEKANIPPFHAEVKKGGDTTALEATGDHTADVFFPDHPYYKPEKGEK